MENDIRKLIVVSITLLVTFFDLNAQSNLQFNQVITRIGQISFCSSTTTWTVPAGKVWKVEFYTKNWNMLYLNGFNVPATGSQSDGLLWLKEGDFVRFTSTCNVNAGFTSPQTYVFSAIEYNIVP